MREGYDFEKIYETGKGCIVKLTKSNCSVKSLE